MPQHLAEHPVCVLKSVLDNVDEVVNTGVEVGGLQIAPEQRRQDAVSG